MWRFCRPIGSDCCWQINGRLGLRIVANHGGIINPHEQIQLTFALKKSSNVRANKTPRSRHAGHHCRTEYGPSNAQQYIHDGQWPEWESYRPDRVNYPDFHTTSEDHAAWIINLQTGRRASASFITSPYKYYRFKTLYHLASALKMVFLSRPKPYGVVPKWHFDGVILTPWNLESTSCSLRPQTTE
jgi:hypothetical protein